MSRAPFCTFGCEFSAHRSERVRCGVFTYVTCVTVCRASPATRGCGSQAVVTLVAGPKRGSLPLAEPKIARIQTIRSADDISCTWRHIDNRYLSAPVNKYLTVFDQPLPINALAVVDITR